MERKWQETLLEEVVREGPPVQRAGSGAELFK